MSDISQAEKDFYDEIAQAIMEAEHMTTIEGFGQITMGRLGQMLKAAARMGAEASTTLMPEHAVSPAMWVCAVCHQPIVLQEENEDLSEWVHA